MNNECEKIGPNNDAVKKLKRLFDLYGKEWAETFNFSKLDKFYHPINAGIVDYLFVVSEKENTPNNFPVADANGQDVWLEDIIESLEEAIKASGAVKKLFNTMWMDDQSGSVYGVMWLNQMGSIVLWYPNTSSYTSTGICLSGMSPVIPIEAQALREKHEIEQLRKRVKEYDKEHGNPFFASEFKTDPRPKKAGWAPGNYTCKCCVCNAAFIGDKRAVTCADCAYRTEEKDEPKTEK